MQGPKGPDAGAGRRPLESLRLTRTATMAEARLPIQIDIGFGAVVTPQASEVTDLLLPDFPPSGEGLSGKRQGRRLSLSGVSWLTQVTPISFMPRSISSFIRLRACSTPFWPAAARA